jgi:hypothetical protein
MRTKDGVIVQMDSGLGLGAHTSPVATFEEVAERRGTHPLVSVSNTYEDAGNSEAAVSVSGCRRSSRSQHIWAAPAKSPDPELGSQDRTSLLKSSTSLPMREATAHLSQRRDHSGQALAKHDRTTWAHRIAR